MTPSAPATLALVFRTDVAETLRARWYRAYVLVFAATMGAFFAFGLGDSSVMGFTGLGRSLLTFIQAVIVVMPVFVLMTTARTLVADRELGVWEYVLAWPLSLRAYYWGKVGGRVVSMTAPLALAPLGAGLFVGLRGGAVPWGAVLWTTGLVVALAVAFVGLALLLSVLVKTQEVALGAAFALWLVVEALIDTLLLGLLVRLRLPAEAVAGLALLNPVQAFRTAALAVFDPELTVLGPISHLLLEEVGRSALLAWAIAWPVVIGLTAAAAGAALFQRKDLIA